MPTSAPTIEQGAKQLLRGLSASKPGDLLRPADFSGQQPPLPDLKVWETYLDYAVQRGWLEEVPTVREKGKDYRLTKDGFVVAQSAG